MKFIKTGQISEDEKLFQILRKETMLTGLEKSMLMTIV
jgi:hypothetical protein